MKWNQKIFGVDLFLRMHRNIEGMKISEQECGSQIVKPARTKLHSA
jgi:hypothetical protein